MFLRNDYQLQRNHHPLLVMQTKKQKLMYREKKEGGRQTGTIARNGTGGLMDFQYQVPFLPGGPLQPLHRAGIQPNTLVQQYQFVYDCSSFKLVGTHAVFIFFVFILKYFLPSSLAHFKNIFLTITLKNWRWNIWYTITGEIFRLLA